DLILEQQLALLQALQLQLVEGRGLLQANNGVVEIAMLLTQLFELAPQLGHAGRRARIGRGTHGPESTINRFRRHSFALVDGRSIADTAAATRSRQRKPMAAIQRIGILTSGGDCAGLNPVIRAVVSRASALGWTVVGIRNGTAGLLARPVEAIELDRRVTGSDMLRLGGTILGTTNKGDPFAFPTANGHLVDRSDEVIDGYRQLRLDALIGIGGDGSFKILR